ncbi:MAG TPA: hypothetical protein VJ837_00745 [Candidatus Paceibacterota bacterium]|nr:hypothetical protein [Candidatus Paceibacterota bacterium]
MKQKKALYLIVGGALVIVLALFLSFVGDSKYLTAAKAGGDYLTSHMEEDGSFIYEYDPVEREESGSYNILRHAGTTYALLELFEATGDEKYLRAAESALTYLRTSSVPCPRYAGPRYAEGSGEARGSGEASPRYAEASCILEDNEIKLGGNGLALLALTKYMELTRSRDDLELAEGLARFIVALQAPNGRFLFFKMDGSGVSDRDFVSLYYPGEALFALARLSTLTGEREWMEAAHRGAKWVITVRDSDTPTGDLEHDHWMLYALRELVADDADPMYVGHAARLVSAIVAAQHRDETGEQSEWNGGYYNPPRSTPTATRNEGLGAAHDIFTRAGDLAYTKVARDAMERGIGFTLRTQFTPRTLRRAGAAPDALGGFHEGLDDYDIRIDYVQHNISALLAFERIRKSR